MLLQVCSGLFVGPVVRLAAPRAHKDALQRRALVRGQPHLEVQPRWGLEEPRRHRLHLQILVRRRLAPEPKEEEEEDEEEEQEEEEEEEEEEGEEGEDGEEAWCLSTQVT